MSIQTTQSSTKEVSDVSITQHAVNRYIERVSVSPYPRQEIREGFRKGDRQELVGFEDPARLHQGVAYVFDEDDLEITTIVEPRDEQLGSVSTNPDASGGFREEYRHQGTRGVGHE